MKGIVFNLLNEVVIQEHGEDAWDVLLEASHLSGSYTALGNYPDEEIFQIVRAASEEFKLSPGEVLRWFGRRSLPILANRYPKFFEGHEDTRSFLLTLNTIIHPEVRKLYSGADVPEFEFDNTSKDVLVMGYRSRRKLCALAKGFIEGAGVCYREHITIEEQQCMHDGHEKCLLQVTFSPWS